MNRPVRKLLAAAVAASVAAPVVPVLAQGNVLEEVIVTARKREESIMKVPVVVAALGGEQLSQYQIDDLSKITEQIAGLNIGKGNTYFGSQVSLRGVGTSVLSGSIDQSVSLNIDGVQMTQGMAYTQAFFDVAQVEVFKGPQALFYGKASPGGVIAVRTADPTDEFEASLSAGYEFEAEEQMYELVLSGPLGETVSARLAARYSDSEGYFENNNRAPEDYPLDDLDNPFQSNYGSADPDERRVPVTETTLLRGTLLWEPNSAFDAKLKLNYSEKDVSGDGWGQQYYDCPEGTASWSPFNSINSPNENCDLDETVSTLAMNPEYFGGDLRNGGHEYLDSELTFASLELNYDFGNDLTLTSVTGLFDMEVESNINGTIAANIGPTLTLGADTERKDFTQELRLTSDNSGPVNFMLGAFYQDGEMDNVNELHFNEPLFLDFAVWNQLGLSAAQLVDQFPDPVFPVIPGQPPFNGADIVDFLRSQLPQINALHEVDIETVSLFGQALWQITPELELGVGVRWTDEERKYTQTNRTTGENVPVPISELSSDHWSPEVSLTYTPSDALTIFGALKQAYKSGSFDSSGLYENGADPSYDDERVRGAELGVKSLLLDGALSLNAAAYYYEYTDMQVGANDFTEEQLVIRTLNAGSSEIYGVDVDFTYASQNIEGLTLRGAVNWNIAEYDEFGNAQCYDGQTIADGCDRILVDGVYNAQDLAGERLVRAPEWTGNLGVDYRMPVGNDLTLALGANVTYSDEYLTNLLAEDRMWADSYYKFNANVALMGEKWELALIGTNLGDEIVTGNCVNGDFANIHPYLTSNFGTGTETRGRSGLAELACTPEPGRSIWARLTLRY